MQLNSNISGNRIVANQGMVRRNAPPAANGNGASTGLWGTADARFESWDRDRNGQVTEGEIGLALRQRGLSVNEKAALETFRGRQGELQSASNDNWGTERGGFTRADLTAYRNAGDGEAARLQEQFGIERGLATESQDVRDRARANGPANLSDRIGTRDYYIDRYRDFRRRNPDQKAPDYYMNYGLKYFDRFHRNKSSLQPVSQRWVDRTGVALQRNMEQRRAAGAGSFAALERNPEGFRSFAYGSHPDAYVNSGLRQVPYADRVRIGMTPDVADLATQDGVKQVVETGGRVVLQDAVGAGRSAVDGVRRLGASVF